MEGKRLVSILPITPILHLQFHHLLKPTTGADAHLTLEMGCGCRVRTTNLTVLYMVVEGEDICYMEERATGLSQRA